MINQYDILKNYMFYLFNEQIYNNLAIDLFKIDENLYKIFDKTPSDDPINLNDLKYLDFSDKRELIESSYILNLICKLCRDYNFTNPNYILSDYETLHNIYLEFEQCIILKIEY